jgi:hyperosmotically inducible periplasmic protein
MTTLKRKLPTLLIAVLFVSSLGLTVVAQEKKQLTDAMIKTIIEYRLIRENLQQGNNIQVQVDDHVVRLSGTVRSAAELRRVEKAARGVDDVDKVENQLRVAAGTRTDQKVADEVVRAIRSFAFFDIFDWVEGDVKNGVVTLRGAVREPWRRDDYARLAENIEGVQSVRNEIRALPTSIYDDQIRIAAARQLYGDPRFVRYANRSLPPIHLVVENGKIWLKGAVANRLERQLAETIIRSNVMSFEVVNDLAVDGETAAR